MEYYICAIIKDEQLYLKEWLDYHLSIGFNRIFLYEDFTSMSHSSITMNYDNVELHSMKDIPSCEQNKVGRQIAVYNYFIETHKEGWCLFIDIDEYFRMDDGVSLDSLSSEFENDGSGIEIPWKCYGANNHISRPDCGIQAAYSADYKPEWNPYWRFKSFVNLAKSGENHFINCHYHRRVYNTEHVRGDFRQERNKLSYNLCHIDHYITKSWEDYVKRLQRGNITKGIRDEDFFFNVNSNMLAQKDILLSSLCCAEFPSKDLDNGMRCDYKIMGVPSRMENIKLLESQLGITDSDIFLDTEYRHNPMWTWSHTATLPHESGITHSVIVQDDAVLCDDFKDFCNYLSNRYPDIIFMLHNYQDWDESKASRRVKYGDIFQPGSVCGGIVILLPVKYIQQIVDCWNSNWPKCINDDEVVCYWAYRNGVKVCSTYPTCCSTLQEEDGYPSLVGHSENDRFSRNMVKNAMCIYWKNKTESPRIFHRNFNDEPSEG